MSATEIDPGQGVAVFALPIPASAMAMITDCVERVYGTGETMLEFKGQSMQINAPADGFGPRRTTGKRPPRSTDDEMRVIYQDYVDGKITMTIEDQQYRIAMLGAIMAQYFDAIKATNYVEMQLRSQEGEMPFVLTLQLASGLTPHQARQSAEARIDNARTYLERTLTNVDPAYPWSADDQREAIQTALDLLTPEA